VEAKIVAYLRPKTINAGKALRVRASRQTVDS
jgi:major vault protein